MDEHHFDALAQTFGAGASTRRKVARGLFGGALAALLGLAAPDLTEAHNALARCRRIKQRPKRAACIRRARRHNTVHQTPRADMPVSPPPPTICVASECPDPGLCKVRACADNVCAPESVPNGSTCGTQRVCASGDCCPEFQMSCFGVCHSLACAGSRAGSCNDRCLVQGTACCGGLFCRRTELGDLRCRP